MNKNINIFGSLDKLPVFNKLHFALADSNHKKKQWRGGSCLVNVEGQNGLETTENQHLKIIHWFRQILQCRLLFLGMKI